MTIKDAMAEGVESFLKDEPGAERDTPYLYEQEAKKERPSKISRWHRWVNEEVEFSWTGLVSVCIVIGLIFWAVIFELIP
jgi:hypothetical protein